MLLQLLCIAAPQTHIHLFQHVVASWAQSQKCVEQPEGWTALGFAGGLLLVLYSTMEKSQVKMDKVLFCGGVKQNVKIKMTVKGNLCSVLFTHSFHLSILCGTPLAL